MTDGVATVLAPWSSFYVITGSSAAALTGLMFVVITLVRRSGASQSTTRDGVAAFSTPTVLHFCVALLVSAILSAPWHSLVVPGALIAAAGLYGIIYILRVLLIAARFLDYIPDLEDWVWYTIAPFFAYVTVFAAAIALLHGMPAGALFVLAAGVVLLIFIGIRNAWDVSTYIAVGNVQQGPPPPPE